MCKIINIFLLLFLINCSSNKIKVYIDNASISKEGIDAWGENIEYVNTTGIGDFINKPDVMVFLAETKNPLTLGSTLLDQKPVIIYIYYTNDVVISHEFGHYLLGPDHSIDTQSIMYPSQYNLNKPLSWFTEFKNE